MACYTISDCVLQHLDDGKKYTTDLLLTFTQDNEHTIAIDKKEQIKEIYANVAGTYEDENIKTGVIYWLFLMTQKPTKWEHIDIDYSDDLFLMVCSGTIDKKLIVSSENNCKWKENILPDRKLQYNGGFIHILNKNEAISELSPKKIEINGSIVATEGSEIKNIKMN